MIAQYTTDHQFIATFRDEDELYKKASIKVDTNSPYPQYGYYWHLEYVSPEVALINSTQRNNKS